jgi:hypothetical protein
MGADIIVAKAKQAGITLYLREGQLRYQGDRQAVELLLPELRAHKAEIIEALIHARGTEGIDSVGGVGRREVENGGEGAALQRAEGCGRSLVAHLTPEQTCADSNSLLNGADSQYTFDSSAIEPLRECLEAADKPQFAARAFLYSVIRDGGVERAILVSKDIRTEPLALEHLRQRFPWLKVQWAQLITHPVCSGCKHYTGGVLCNADRSPEHVVKVGRCGRYEAARPPGE